MNGTTQQTAPLTPMQRLVAAPSIVVGGAVRLAAALEPAEVFRAARAVCARHAALRTTVHTRAGRQVVHRFDGEGGDMVRTVVLEVDPARALDELARAGSAAIDPSTLPVLRCAVAAVPSRRETLVHLASPHAVCDRSSLGIVFRDFLRALAAQRAGRDLEGASAHAPFADHVRERDGRHRDPATWRCGPGAGALRFWSERLAGVTLPRWKHPPPGAPSALERMAFARGGADAHLALRMRQRCAALGCSPFHLLLAAYEEAVARTTGTADVTTVSLVHGRGRPELNDAVGLFIEEVAFRRTLGGGSRAQHLRAVAADVLGTYLHQALSLPAVAEHSAEVARLYAQRRFRSMVLQYRPQRLGERAEPVAGLAVEFLGGMDGSAGWRLPGFAILSVDDDGNRLDFELMYDPTLWDGGQLREFLAAFRSSCEAFADPDDPAPGGVSPA